MANRKKDDSLTQGIIRLEQFVTKTQAAIQQMEKSQAEIKQFLIGQNTGANAVADAPNCELNEDCVDNTGSTAVVEVPNCELNEDCVKVEEATLCFRVGGKVCNKYFIGTEVVRWFAINRKGCLSPYIEEPPCDLGLKKTPLAIGPNIFLISDVRTDWGSVSNLAPFRVVHYLNMQNVYEEAKNPWNKASSFVGKQARLCHFLVANDRIYAFGFLNNGNTLCVSYIDFHKPDQGWTSLLSPDNVEPCSSTGPLESFCCIPASAIEFVTNDGEPGRRVRRALIFSKKCLLSYDFDTGSYELSELPEVFLFNEIHCSLCTDGGVFYLLIRDSDDRFSLVVYNHHDKERGYTQVFGLDDFLPEDDTGHGKLPKLRLVHLGNERLCLIWPIELGFDIEVRCTKFTVKVLDGEYHATNVSSRVYTVEGFSSDNFEAVVVSVFF